MTGISWFQYEVTGVVGKMREICTVFQSNSVLIRGNSPNNTVLFTREWPQLLKHLDVKTDDMPMLAAACCILQNT